MESKLFNVDENKLYEITRTICGKLVTDTVFIHSKMIHADCISYFASWADGSGNQFVHEYNDPTISDGNIVGFRELVDIDKREIIVGDVTVGE